MKKILCLILALVVCLSFAACAGQEEETADKLVIGYTIYEPMNYMKDGKLVGFDTEFAEAVCAKLGVEPEFVEINWDTKFVTLDANKIDCIWNGMTIDDDRKANMEITIPYMNNKQVLVTKAENADTYNSVLGLNGANVVAEEGSAGETVATTDETFAGSNFTPVGAQSDVLLEIKSGTSDAGIIDYVMSIGSIGEGTDYADLVAVDSMSFAPEEYGVAFRKGSDAAEKVNEAMRELAKDGTLNTIATKYKLQDLSLTNVITSLLIGGIILLIT